MCQIAAKIAAQIFCWTLCWWHKEAEILANITALFNSQNNIILSENDCIISDAEEVAKVFNEYFAGIVDCIGFCDPIPDDFIDD